MSVGKAEMERKEPVLVKIVFMGDSITSGEYIERDKIWTTIVTENLQEEYLNTPVNIYALNKGVGGDTTRMALERFPEDVQSIRPDIVTIQFGMNDCNCWLSDEGLPRVSVDAFRANLQEMLDRVWNFCGTPILLNNHKTLRNKLMMNSVRYEDANRRYSEVIEEVATATGAWFCGIRSQFGAMQDKKLESMLLPYPDQIHLSEAGHIEYASHVLDTIGKIMPYKLEYLRKLEYRESPTQNIIIEAE